MAGNSHRDKEKIKVCFEKDKDDMGGSDFRRKYGGLPFSYGHFRNAASLPELRKAIRISYSVISR